MSAEWQSAELWRAAVGDKEGTITRDLASSVMANACDIVERERSPVAAISRFENLVIETGSAGLAFDMAKRALARATASQAGASDFARELFAEAASYYVARDLPSYVGSEGRVATTSDAIAFKESIRGIARAEAVAAGTPSKEPEAWRDYVSAVLRRLNRS